MVEILAQNKQKKTLIRFHGIAEIRGVDQEKLKDPNFLMDNLRDSLIYSSFTILEEKVMKFPGIDSGVTGFFILSESHAAFHSYPEYEYISLDIFSCGLASPFDAIKYFSKLINAKHFEIDSIERGLNIA